MHKTLLIIGILILIFTGLLYLTTRPKDNNLSDKPQPSPTSIPQSQIFAVESLNPPATELMQITYVTPITITFNQTVDPKGFEFKIEPSVDVSVGFENKKVTFKPKVEGPWWAIDQEYTLTILSARSTQGIEMGNPYKITFKAPKPTF